jgi:hypothetical protein
MSSASENAGHGQKRPGDRRGHVPEFTDVGTMEQAMPSLPASCLLAQAVIACDNVKLKHVPALTDPGLTTLYLTGGWPLSSSTHPCSRGEKGCIPVLLPCLHFCPVLGHCGCLTGYGPPPCGF